MRKVLGTALGAAALVAATAATAGSAQAEPAPGVAPAAGGTVHGCPHGYVCVYPKDKGWNNDHPTPGMEYYTYGPHNFSGQYGHHYVLNNQIGSYGAATLCYGSDGKKCSGPTYTLPWDFTHSQGTSWGNPDFTKLNSILLYQAT